MAVACISVFFFVPLRLIRCFQVEWDIGICGLAAVSEEIGVNEDTPGIKAALKDSKYNL